MTVSLFVFSLLVAKQEMHESISHSSPDKQTSPERLSRPQTGIHTRTEKEECKYEPNLDMGTGE